MHWVAAAPPTAWPQPVFMLCCALPVQDCVAKARAALSPQLLSAATAAAAAANGIEIVEAAAAAVAAGAASPAGSAAALAAATGAAAGAGQGVGFEDRSLTRKEEASLLAPLLRLRQACCHPQV